jgi:hypothetical protein
MESLENENNFKDHLETEKLFAEQCEKNSPENPIFSLSSEFLNHVWKNEEGLFWKNGHLRSAQCAMLIRASICVCLFYELLSANSSTRAQNADAEIDEIKLAMHLPRHHKSSRYSGIKALLGLLEVLMPEYAYPSQTLTVKTATLFQLVTEKAWRDRMNESEAIDLFKRKILLQELQYKSAEKILECCSAQLHNRESSDAEIQCLNTQDFKILSQYDFKRWLLRVVQLPQHNQFFREGVELWLNLVSCGVSIHPKTRGSEYLNPSAWSKVRVLQS